MAIFQRRGLMAVRIAFYEDPARLKNSMNDMTLEGAGKTISETSITKLTIAYVKA